ncbi:MAG: KH domain-containing protein, partial [Clostridia bacterium]|nr:KH domain-containing protein [Clostridia bacterium]
MPKKKVLGLFGGCPAKVRAFYELPDEKPLKRVEKYERADKKSAAKKQPKPQAEQPKKAQKAETEKAPAQPEQKLELVPIEDAAKKAAVDNGVAFLENVLNKMEVEAKITSGQLGSNLAIVLEGDHLGTIVGRRGETLDALQYLTMLVANRGEGEYQRITLNIGDYREKRERTLRSLARRMANQALKQGRNMTLEPMNPYERR